MLTSVKEVLWCRSFRVSAGRKREIQAEKRVDDFVRIIQLIAVQADGASDGKTPEHSPIPVPCGIRGYALCRRIDDDGFLGEIMMGELI